MAVKQQFIIDMGEDATVLGDPFDGSNINVLLKDRAAAESLFEDLREALGLGSYTQAYVPSQEAEVRRITRDLDTATTEDPTDMSKWSAEELQAFFAENDVETVTEIEEDEVPLDPDMAAAMEQVKTRRELQMADPANSEQFSPRVAATVPPNEPKGSAIGARHLHQPPEQAY